MLGREHVQFDAFEQSSLGQRAPRLDENVPRPTVLDRFVLGHTRVQFDLIDHRRDVGLFEQRVQVARLEVADADGAHAPFPV